MMSVSVNPSLSTCEYLKPIFTKLGIYIMSLEPVSTAYFINTSHQFACLYVYLSIVTRQRLGKNVTTAKNIHVTVKELLDASFSMRPVSYRKNVGD
jgi:hypothetical protein